MRIAWVTPFGRQSAIGNCSARICPTLARRHEVIIYAADLDNPLDPWSCKEILECHMGRAIVRWAHGVVTHSEFACKKLAGLAGAPVTQIDFPAPPIADAAAHWGTRTFRKGIDRVRFLTFGALNPN